MYITLHRGVFSNETLFLAGSVIIDNALLMRNIAHSWQRLPQMKSTIRT